MNKMTSYAICLAVLVFIINMLLFYTNSASWENLLFVNCILLFAYICPFYKESIEKNSEAKHD